MKLIKSFLAVSSTAVLFACGGGGDSAQSNNSGIPPASTAAPLSIANFGNIAGPSAASILATAGVNSGLDTLSSNGTSSSFSQLRNSPSDWALWVLNAAKPSLEQTQASQSGNEVCPGGGSLNFTFNDNDNNNDVSRGDTLSFTANNCIFATGELPINGSFAIAINSITYGAFDKLVAASLTMSFTNFSSAGNTLNGSVAISVNNNSVTTTYTNFYSTRRNSSSATLNYTSVINSSGQLSISGLITVNNNTYTLNTVTPITFGLNYPTSGLLRVTDAAGSRVDIISNSTAGGSFDCDLYLSGDQIRDGRISSPWSAL